MATDIPIDDGRSNPVLGINVPPWIVGLLRSLFVLVAVAVIGAIVTFLEGDELALALLDLPPVAQIAIAGFVPAAVRFFEGLADQLKKPAQNDDGVIGPGDVPQ